MASARVDIAPKKARVLSPGIVAWVQHLPFAWPLSPPDAEEQRALDEKQGRVERDRSKQLHGYDGGWWAKKSPYLGAKDGGSALIAVRKDQVLSHSAARAEARRGARLARRAAGWRPSASAMPTACRAAPPAATSAPTSMPAAPIAPWSAASRWT